METFDSINWTEEAKRLEVAFDIGKPCEFVRYPGEDWRSLLVRNSDPLLPAGRLRVGYTEESRNFNIIHSLKRFSEELARLVADEDIFGGFTRASRGRVVSGS